jgi:predicted regulator of amino acid metabolism with ACT domain
MLTTEQVEKLIEEHKQKLINKTLEEIESDPKLKALFDSIEKAIIDSIPNRWGRGVTIEEENVYRKYCFDKNKNLTKPQIKIEKSKFINKIQDMMRIFGYSYRVDCDRKKDYVIFYW